jgi:hypothetical protein
MNEFSEALEVHMSLNSSFILFKQLISNMAKKSLIKKFAIA